MKRRWPFILITVLLLTNLITAAFLVRHMWHNWLWEQQMFGQATYSGTLQAIGDFRSGELRVYRVVPDGRSQFTGQMDDEFEIWTWPSHADSNNYPFEYTAKVFVDAYNSRMRNMVAYPDHFELDYEVRRKLSGMKTRGNAPQQLTTESPEDE